MPPNILLVTVTKVEAQAVLKIFSDASGQPWQRRIIGDKTYYSLGVIGGAEVFMVQSEMGAATSGGALITVHKAIESLQPIAVIMVGLAFGIRPDDQQLGDVLVSRQIMSYEPAKIEGHPIPRGDRATASNRLLDLFRSGDMDWSGAPVKFGLILSGEKLISDQTFRDHLIKLEPESIGSDMEGAGLYITAVDAKVDWILVKAICDWADGKKNDDAQQLAACNAAKFVCHVLQIAEFGKTETRMTLPEQLLPHKAGTPSTFNPISLVPGIGNSYLGRLYLNPPTGDIQLDGVQFHLSPDSLIFDTNEQPRYYLTRQDGGKEIEIQLNEPIANVKKVHFLINSGNSKSVYAGRKIGEISLRFGNVHPFTIDLILGHNIREWAVGNQGDLVREFADSSVQQAWQGMNRQGINAVIDHLEITIPEVIQNAILEKIVLVHLPTHHATDSLGVHYLVLAVTIEVG